MAGTGNQEKLLSLLGLARRAGKVEPGFDAAVTAAREGKAALLVAAGDISPKTEKNLRYEGDRAGIPTVRIGTGMEALGRACGIRAGVLAVTDKGFAKAAAGLAEDVTEEEEETRPMMIKYRVREVAKDLNIPNKEVIDTLAKYFPEPKKYMTALEEPELDVIFETFTQRNSVKNLDAYFAQREGDAPPRPRQPPSRRARPGSRVRLGSSRREPEAKGGEKASAAPAGGSPAPGDSGNQGTSAAHPPCGGYPFLPCEHRQIQ